MQRMINTATSATVYAVSAPTAPITNDDDGYVVDTYVKEGSLLLLISLLLLQV